ncbi:MAG: hypothetical protein M3P49_17765, partial [Actinomycetota bacterium]|nr:hypothetical protein [Actinomycetota bacterium]
LSPQLAALMGMAALVALGLGGLLYYSGLAHRLFSDEGRRRPVAWALTVAWVVLLSVLLLTTRSGLNSFSLEFLREYAVEELAAYTPLWPLLPIAAAYAVLRAVRGHRLWEVYYTLIFLQVPVSLLALVEDFDHRQFIVLQTLLFGALAALLVGTCKVALRGRGLSRLASIPAAVLFVAVLLLSGASQVGYLLQGPVNMSGYSSNHVRLSIQDMSRWIDENVPEDENVLTTWWDSYQMAFFDGSRHGWANLDLDCERGPRNLVVDDCVFSEALAGSPPQQTVWFQMEDCGAVALSMPTLLRQMERADAQYLMITSDNKYPGLSQLKDALVESGAFEVAHVSRQPRENRDDEPRDLVLLKRTGEPPGPVPTHMDPVAVSALVNCEREESGRRFADSIRAAFPNGIATEPRPVQESRMENESKRHAAAERKIERIYGAS